MNWKPLFWAAHHIFGIVSLVAFAIIIGVRNRCRARDLSGGRIEFAPSRLHLCACAVIAIFFANQSIDFARRGQGNLFNLLTAAFPGLCALTLLAELPGTVVISSDKLEQVRWFWRNNRIRWKDIVEINTGKKSRTVTITGADGTKIVHSRQLADRPRILLELKQHCGENLPPDFPREPIVPLKTDMHV